MVTLLDGIIIQEVPSIDEIHLDLFPTIAWMSPGSRVEPVSIDGHIASGAIFFGTKRIELYVINRYELNLVWPRSLPYSAILVSASAYRSLEEPVLGSEQESGRTLGSWLGCYYTRSQKNVGRRICRFLIPI